MTSEPEGPSKPWWQRWWAIGLGILIVLVVIAGIFGGGADDEDAAADATTPAEPTASSEVSETSSNSAVPETTDAPTTTAAATTTATATTTTTTLPATTTTTLPQFGTGENPAPVGDPELSTFTYSDFVGDEWDGYVAGLVETGPGRFNDDPGRCLVLLGTITATSVDGGTTNPFGTPSFSLIVDGRVLDSEVSECDTSAIEAAGYDWILNAEVTEGTTFAFFDEFFLPEGSGEPEVLLAGNASSSDVLYFQPTIIGEIPPPTESVGAGARDLIPVGDPELSTFTYSDFVGDEWDGYVAGLVETGPGRFNDDPGRCLVLLGTITATSVDGAATNPFGTPSFSLIVDGRVLDSEVSECDTSAIEAAGYDWILNAEVTEGTTFAFFDEFFLPEGSGEPEAIVGGSSSGSDALYFDPTPRADIPTP